MAAGSCERPGVAGVFTYAGGRWRSAGLALPATFGGNQVQVLGLAAVPAATWRCCCAGNSLLAAWWDRARWTVSDPVAAGTLRALGFGAGGSAWALLGGGRAETIGGAGRLVAGAAARAAGHRRRSRRRAQRWAVATGGATGGATAAGSYEALAVSGSRLTVWRLAQQAWAKVQLITVPIQYGSSG